MTKIFIRFYMLLVFALLPACGDGPEKPIRVGTNNWPGYACLYLAQDLGYYGETPIEIKEYPSASEVMGAFRNGFIEAAALTMDEVLQLKEGGHNPKIALILDFSHGGDVILGKPGVEDLASLKGMRVGVESSALGAFFFARALEQVQMAPKDVTIVHIPLDKHEKAFKDGIIDAVVTFEPVRSKLLESGANLLFDSTQIAGEIIDVLAVHESGLSNNSFTLRSLLSGWFQAMDYLKKNPEGAADLISSHLGLTPAQFISSLQGFHLPDMKENRVLFRGEKVLLKSRMERLIHFLRGNGVLKQSIDPLSLLDARLVEQ